MRTDDLIRTLAADSHWRSMPTGTALLIALIAAAPLSLVFFGLVLGPRPDFATAIHSAFFDLKFAVTSSLAVSSIVLALLLAKPGASPGKRSWLLLAPIALLAIGVVFDFVAPQTRSWSTRLVGSNALVCLPAIPAMAAPLLAATLIALRHGAATRPAMSGAMAGLLSGALAATVYAAHCTDDSPLFVATWYSIGIAVLAAAGAMIGRRVLRI